MPFELLVTYCPSALLNRHEQIRRRTALAVPANRGLPQLVRQLVVDVADRLHAGALMGVEANVADSLLGLFEAMYEISLPAHGAAGCAPELLLGRIRRFIDSNLEDRALCPDLVARRHFISRSYLDKLFETEPEGVARYIRERRLERCREELADPRLTEQSILDIATRWGFVSAAHFSRVFRAAYGMTPREARRQSGPSRYSRGLQPY
jgi:AraC-like DNA-binding protein